MTRYSGFTLFEVLICLFIVSSLCLELLYLNVKISVSFNRLMEQNHALIQQYNEWERVAFSSRNHAE